MFASVTGTEAREQGRSIAARLDRGPQVGATGAHGAIRYEVDRYQSGSTICFRFTAPQGLQAGTASRCSPRSAGAGCATCSKGARPGRERCHRPYPPATAAVVTARPPAPAEHRSRPATTCHPTIQLSSRFSRERINRP